MPFEVILGKSFKQCVKRLKKRYRNLPSDVADAIRLLQADPTCGDVIEKTRGVRKLRCANTSAQRGKSGGFRIIYYYHDVRDGQLLMLYLYSKSDAKDVDEQAIEQLLLEDLRTL